MNEFELEQEKQNDPEGLNASEPETEPEVMPENESEAEIDTEIGTENDAEAETAAEPEADPETVVLNIEAGTATAAEPKAKKSAVATAYEYIETFCYALALMMVLFLFVFRYVSVDGDSMKDTLHNEDKLIISNLFYTPETGDIVVINPENHGGDAEPIIKRVIATEGQTVLIDYKNWAVYVDGVKLDEPYIEAARKASIMETGNLFVGMNVSNVPEYMQTFTVGEGMVFVMGDNRNHSKDSRDASYGEMGVNRILGRVIIRISPDFGFVE